MFLGCLPRPGDMLAPMRGGAVRPMLKNAVWERLGPDLNVIMDPETELVLGDPDGMVEYLLELLREGTRDPATLAGLLTSRFPQVGETDVTAALGALDDLGLLVDAAVPDPLTGVQRERYFSNLAFFTAYASLDRPTVSFQRALADAHVIFLGTGGLGSTVIQALTGAGVGRMTLLDNDTVELRNFARQYLYREEDIGSSKVKCAKAWVEAFNSAADVRAVNRWIKGPDDIADLLTDANLVVSGVDHPDDIDFWVNQACVAAGVPFVRGGMLLRRVSYWSVDPGRSGCRVCLQHTVSADSSRIDRMLSGLDRVNRGIGPVASMVGAAVAMEAVRYLTGFAEPIAAGQMRYIDCGTGAEEVIAWEPWPDCPVCATAPAARPGAEPARDRADG
jgi:molybdopterin/thiamine biosynthesis adenylyltransferase